MAVENSIIPPFNHEMDLNDLGVEEIVDHTEWLMIRYCRKPSIFLANLIVSSLEMLISREDYDEPSERDWASPRLLKQWAYIARYSRTRV